MNKTKTTPPKKTKHISIDEKANTLNFYGYKMHMEYVSPKAFDIRTAAFLALEGVPLISSNYLEALRELALKNSDFWENQDEDKIPILAKSTISAKIASKPSGNTWDPVTTYQILTSGDAK